MRLHGIYFSALWLHGSDADLLIPIAPVFSGHETDRAYPAGDVLEDLRDAAAYALENPANLPE